MFCLSLCLSAYLPVHGRPRLNLPLYGGASASIPSHRPRQAGWLLAPAACGGGAWAIMSCQQAPGSLSLQWQRNGTCNATRCRYLSHNQRTGRGGRDGCMAACAAAHTQRGKAPWARSNRLAMRACGVPLKRQGRCRRKQGTNSGKRRQPLLIRAGAGVQVRVQVCRRSATIAMQHRGTAGLALQPRKQLGYPRKQPLARLIHLALWVQSLQQAGSSYSCGQSQPKLENAADQQAERELAGQCPCACLHAACARRNCMCAQSGACRPCYAMCAQQERASLQHLLFARGLSERAVH